MNEKTCAIIVTYNRLNFLKELLQAIRSQTKPLDEIIVVNNDSNDGTKEWLDSQSGIIVIHQANLGGAGGFHRGVKEAYERGADWFWIMDDDVAPANNCLEKLLDNSDKNIVRSPLRIAADGQVFFNEAIDYNLTNPFKSFWVEILSEKHLSEKYISAVGLTFEGPLFHRSLVEKIGFPVKKYFIYGDDTDYWLKAKKAGYRMLIFQDAKLFRKLPYITEDLKKYTWKHYYIIRNSIAHDVIHGNAGVRFIRPFWFMFKYFLQIRRLKDFKVWLKASIDGYFFKEED